MAHSILVLEESSSIPGIIASALEDSDLIIYHENQPDQFFKIAKQLLPDLIFISNSDHKQEYAVCQQLKRNSELARIPVVVLAESRDKMDETALSRLKIAGYLRKPFEAAALQDQVRRLLPAAFSVPAAEAYASAQSNLEKEANAEEDFSVFDDEMLDLISEQAGEPRVKEEDVPEVDFSEDFENSELEIEEENAIMGTVVDTETELMGDNLSVSEISSEIDSIDPSEFEELALEEMGDNESINMAPFVEEMLDEEEAEGLETLDLQEEETIVEESSEFELEEESGIEMLDLAEEAIMEEENPLNQLKESGLEDEMVQAQTRDTSEEDEFLVVEEESSDDLFLEEPMLTIDEPDAEEALELEEEEETIELDEEEFEPLKLEGVDPKSVEFGLQNEEDFESIGEKITLVDEDEEELVLDEDEEELSLELEEEEGLSLDDQLDVGEEGELSLDAEEEGLALDEDEEEDALVLEENDSTVAENEEEGAYFSQEDPTAQKLREGLIDIQLGLNDFEEWLELETYDDSNAQELQKGLVEINLDENDFDPQLPEILSTEDDDSEEFELEEFQTADEFLEMDGQVLGLSANEENVVEDEQDALILADEGTLSPIEEDSFSMEEPEEMEVDFESEPEEEFLEIESVEEGIFSESDSEEIALDFETDLAESLELESVEEETDSVPEAITKDEVFEESLVEENHEEVEASQEDAHDLEAQALSELDDLDQEMTQLENEDYDLDLENLDDSPALESIDSREESEIEIEDSKEGEEMESIIEAPFETSEMPMGVELANKSTSEQLGKLLENVIASSVQKSLEQSMPQLVAQIVKKIKEET